MLCFKRKKPVESSLEKVIEIREPIDKQVEAERLAEFYKKHNVPEKAVMAKDLIEKHSTPEELRKLWENLSQKYNDVPPPYPPAKGDSSKTDVNSGDPSLDKKQSALSSRSKSGDKKLERKKSVSSERSKSGDKKSERKKSVSSERSKSGDKKSERKKSVSSERSKSGDKKSERKKSVSSERSKSGDKKSEKKKSVSDLKNEDPSIDKKQSVLSSRSKSADKKSERKKSVSSERSKSGDKKSERKKSVASDPLSGDIILKKRSKKDDFGASVTIIESDTLPTEDTKEEMSDQLKKRNSDPDIQINKYPVYSDSCVNDAGDQEEPVKNSENKDDTVKEDTQLKDDIMGKKFETLNTTIVSQKLADSPSQLLVNLSSRKKTPVSCAEESIRSSNSIPVIPNKWWLNSSSVEKTSPITTCIEKPSIVTSLVSRGELLQKSLSLLDPSPPQRPHPQESTTTTQRESPTHVSTTPLRSTSPIINEGYTNGLRGINQTATEEILKTFVNKGSGDGQIIHTPNHTNSLPDHAPLENPYQKIKVCPVTVPAVLKILGPTIKELQAFDEEVRYSFMQEIIHDLADSILIDPIQIEVMSVAPGVLLELRFLLSDEEARRNVVEGFVQKAMSGLISLPRTNAFYEEYISPEVPSPIYDGNVSNTSKVYCVPDTAACFGEFRVPDDEAPKLKMLPTPVVRQTFSNDRMPPFKIKSSWVTPLDIKSPTRAAAVSIQGMSGLRGQTTRYVLEMAEKADMIMRQMGHECSDSRISNLEYERGRNNSQVSPSGRNRDKSIDTRHHAPAGSNFVGGGSTLFPKNFSPPPPCSPLSPLIYNPYNFSAQQPQHDRYNVKSPNYHQNNGLSIDYTHGQEMTRGSYLVRGDKSSSHEQSVNTQQRDNNPQHVSSMEAMRDIVLILGGKARI